MDNLDQWKTAFASVGDSGIEGATSSEIADALGLCVDATRVRIRAAIKQGVLVFAGRKKVLRIDGVPMSVPVYRIVEE